MTFYEKMRIVCMSIPAGKVATYGQIAMLCGKPKNSRQVGYGLKHDLAGPDVPAFRVVNSRGELSGAIHFQIPGLQQKLLADDGIGVFWNGNIWCVDLKKYGWKNSIEEAEVFERQFEAADSQ
ncbi:MAG: MGMT family protein [Oscillospiraceae bacterium]|nr:MGMT family protein [Oscillospiraceae bacterium]